MDRRVNSGGHMGYSQQDLDHRHPSADPRDRDRYWGHPDAPYGPPFPGPPLPLRPDPYNHQHSYSYWGPEHHRPQSRHGYDYLPQSQLDYRDAYGYHDYYRGGPDDYQWVPQDPWRTDRFQDRTQRPEHQQSIYMREFRNDSQHYHGDYNDCPTPRQEEISSFYPGTLESSKNSGLSSSSYELSQYMNEVSDAPYGDYGFSGQTLAPLKFSIPHAVVRFGPAGQLIRVSPQENGGLLEFHSLEVILSESAEQQEMRSFPGPLSRNDLHKSEAVDFAQQRAASSLTDTSVQDRSSAALLWRLLVLLCRQNGQTVGSDIAELLMQGSPSTEDRPADAQTLINFDGETSPPPPPPPDDGEDLLTGSRRSSETSERNLQRYTKLLLHGRKKEALEWAMTSDLWGHALFLSSKMDNRTYMTVLSRFMSQLTPKDPLQTLFTLMSRRIPAISTCCGSEKWGEWRPHLAVMLSNETGDPASQRKAIVIMGDTLASRGLVHAAHICYLTAGVSFGAFTQKAERLVLLSSSSHRKSFNSFATNSAIQCTELFEYSQTLGGKYFSIPSFQVYKFLYACRLMDCGLSSLSFHYCEVVGQSILRQSEPFFVLTEELIKLSDRLRFSEFNEVGLRGSGQEPDWLKCLRARHHSLQTGTYDCNEAYLLHPENDARTHEDTEVPSVSDPEDLQRPEPELLYYSEPECQMGLMGTVRGNGEGLTGTTWSFGRDQQGGGHSLSPPTVVTSAVSQTVSCHTCDAAEVWSSAAPHRPPPPPSEGAELSSGLGTADCQILEADISEQHQSQEETSKASEKTEQTETPKQNSKRGWFSGWFRSKPTDDHKENSEQEIPAQTEISPSTGLCPPPPAALFASQPPPAGLNPFSRKAGQQRR
ncbi:protein transport protein Sec16B isoform 1-T1 [Pholidichthys leucotaenia]